MRDDDSVHRSLFGISIFCAERVCPARCVKWIKLIFWRGWWAEPLKHQNKPFVLSRGEWAHRRGTSVMIIVMEYYIIMLLCLIAWSSVVTRVPHPLFFFSVVISLTRKVNWQLKIINPLALNYHYWRNLKLNYITCHVYRYV